MTFTMTKEFIFFTPLWTRGNVSAHLVHTLRSNVNAWRWSKSRWMTFLLVSKLCKSLASFTSTFTPRRAILRTNLWLLLMLSHFRRPSTFNWSFSFFQVILKYYLHEKTKWVSVLIHFTTKFDINFHHEFTANSFNNMQRIFSSLYFLKIRFFAWFFFFFFAIY